MKGRVETTRYYGAGKHEIEEAEVLAYYTEDDPDPLKAPKHYVVLRWINDKTISTRRVQYADSCDDVDGITVKHRVFCLRPTKDTNGFVYEDRETAEEWLSVFEDAIQRAIQDVDLDGFSGCVLNFEVAEEWV